MKEQALRSMGLLMLRMLIGVIFLMQGYGKVFTFGVDQVFEQFFKPSFQETFPNWLLLSTAYCTSWGELIGGSLLILGLFRSYTYILLGSVLLIVSFGHGIIEPIWNMEHVIYRALLLFPLFFLPTSWDQWALDKLIKSKGYES